MNWNCPEFIQKTPAQHTGKGMNWNCPKFIQKTPAQPTGKARNQGATENKYIGHCTHTAASANVKSKPH